MEERLKSFISKNKNWKSEFELLRKLLLEAQLEETIKWGMPTYCIDNQNVIGIGIFKNHIGLWFHQGALLSDPQHILINAQKGKTKAMRSIKITEEDSIDQDILANYIQEATANAKAGKKVKTSTARKVSKEALEIPQELSSLFASNKALKNNFLALTAIQQSDYIQYITEAKRAATKQSRIEKILPLINDRKPLNALWKNC